MLSTRFSFGRRYHIADTIQSSSIYSDGLILHCPRKRFTETYCYLDILVERAFLFARVSTFKSTTSNFLRNLYTLDLVKKACLQKYKIYLYIVPLNCYLDDIEVRQLSKIDKLIRYFIENFGYVTRFVVSF